MVWLLGPPGESAGLVFDQATPVSLTLCITTNACGSMA
jgi:hypothetical protein